MSKFTNKKLSGSLRHAISGIVACYKSQRNFKYQLLVLAFIAVLAFAFKYTIFETSLCIFTIVLVLIMEMLNSCIEFTLDAVYKNKYSTLVKISKDISAGAVLISSISCVIINALILFSKLL